MKVIKEDSLHYDLIFLGLAVGSFKLNSITDFLNT